MFITASSDHTAKLYDTKTLKELKTYHSDRPLNSAALSPTMNHVIVGGGQVGTSNRIVPRVQSIVIAAVLLHIRQSSSRS